MSDSPTELSKNRRAKIDELADRFESEFIAGATPSIEDYLNAAPNLGPRLASELLTVEIQLRKDAGIVPTTADYHDRFPELAGLVHELLAEEREESRNTPDARGAVEVTLPASQQTSAMVGDKVRYFGDYELLEEIARGGMGVVFKAKQINLNRTVALKMILSGNLAGEEEVARFKMEAEAAANLDHPGIVPIFEIGEHEGQHYFSMGFIDGESLQARLRGGPMIPSEAAELCCKIAEAIAYAHENGVIHRDLKPANVLLDCNGDPKVTDFGLAKQVESDSDLTRTGAVMGTPNYMPPEQAAGKTEEIGPAADIYSLGGILYCALTGRPPFQASNTMDILHQVLEKEPNAPRNSNPEIPKDLETICLKSIEKEPSCRYATAIDFAEDLQRFLNGEPVVARPISKLERTWRWCKKHKSLTGLIATGIVLLAMLGNSVVNGSGDQQNPANVKPNEVVAQDIRPNVDVRVWNERGKGVSLLKDLDVLPLGNGDKIRVNATTSVPAYLYLVWIDGGGEVLPLYPWEDFDWERRPQNEVPVSVASFPREPGEWTTLEGGTSVSTVLLVARNAPLTSTDEFKAALAEFPRMTSADVPIPAAVDRELSKGDRAKLGVPQKSEDPILQARQFLNNLLADTAEYDAFAFSSGGESD